MGGMISFLIIIITLSYANLKLVHLIDVTYPTISETIVLNHLQPLDYLNINEINYRLAFTVEGQFEKERKDRPEFTKFLVRRLVINPEEGYREERFIPFHECTDEDYAQFYPINPTSEIRVNNIRTGEKRGFYCIDWEKEDLNIGISKPGYLNYLDIMLVPCNYLGKTALGLTKDDIDENCVADLEA